MRCLECGGRDGRHAAWCSKGRGRSGLTARDVLRLARLAGPNVDGPLAQLQAQLVDALAHSLERIEAAAAVLDVGEPEDPDNVLELERISQELGEAVPVALAVLRGACDSPLPESD